MDILRGDGKLLQNIDLNPPNVHQEVLQNVACIVATFKHSVPMMRGFGIDNRVVHRPVPVAEDLIASQLYEQIEEYEPRAIINQITFETNALTGEVIPLIYIEGVDEDAEN